MDAKLGLKQPLFAQNGFKKYLMFQIAALHGVGVMTNSPDLTASMLQPGSIPIPHPTTLQVKDYFALSYILKRLLKVTVA